MNYIDVYRGVGIVLMIMGHIGFSVPFDKWIHSFNMPMFFIVSGFFYKQQDNYTILLKRMRSLLVPYVVWGIFHCAVYFIMFGNIDYGAIAQLPFENNDSGGVPIAGALWFLPALFFCGVLYNFIWNVKMSNYFKILCTFLISFLGMFITSYSLIKMPFALDAELVGIGLYHVGRCVKEKWNMVINLNLITSLFGIIIFSFLAFTNGDINMRIGNYSNWVLFWIVAVGLSFSIWNLVRIESRCNLRAAKLCNNVLCGIGRDSIVYLCFNQLVIRLTEKIFKFDLFMPAIVGGY